MGNLTTSPDPWPIPHHSSISSELASDCPAAMLFKTEQTAQRLYYENQIYREGTNLLDVKEEEIKDPFYNHPSISFTTKRLKHDAPQSLSESESVPQRQQSVIVRNTHEKSHEKQSHLIFSRLHESFNGQHEFLESNMFEKEQLQGVQHFHNESAPDILEKERQNIECEKQLRHYNLPMSLNIFKPAHTPRNFASDDNMSRSCPTKQKSTISTYLEKRETSLDSPLFSRFDLQYNNFSSGVSYPTDVKQDLLCPTVEDDLCNSTQKGKRGRPRKHPPKITLPPLYVFIRNMLHSTAYNPEVVAWVDEEDGCFKVTSTTEFAKTWGRMKSKRSEEMNYEKMSRAMRYHYGCERQGRKGHLAMVKEKRLCYR